MPGTDCHCSRHAVRYMYVQLVCMYVHSMMIFSQLGEFQ